MLERGHKLPWKLVSQRQGPSARPHLHPQLDSQPASITTTEASATAVARPYANCQVRLLNMLAGIVKIKKPAVRLSAAAEDHGFDS